MDILFAGYEGPEDIDVSITQGGDTGQALIQRSATQPPPALPQAVSDGPYSFNVNEARTLNVLGNDDLQGASISAASVISGGGSVAIVSNATQLRYTAPGSASDVTLEYTKSDGMNPAVCANVAISVVATAPGSGTVTLSARRTTATAPAGFLFHAEANGFGVADPFFDLRYKWTFSDPGWYTRHDTEDLPWGKYFDVSGTTVLMEDGTVPQGPSVTFLGNDKNVAYGPRCSHVFEAPGKYVVTCEVRKRGEAAVVETMTVTLENPDTVFPGTNTICVSTAGDFTGAPVGALLVTSYAAMMAAINSGPEKRVLFRRGENVNAPPVGADRNPSRKGGFDKLHFGVFGPKSDGDAILERAIILDVNAGGENCQFGFDYQGNYDPSDGSQIPTSSGFDLRERGFKTIWDCKGSGGNKIISCAVASCDIIVGNFHGTNWYDYGFFCGTTSGYIGLSGFWMKQNPDAVIGAGKSENSAPYYQDHGPFRISVVNGPIMMNLCDWRSVGSWSGRYQPCIRVGRGNTSGDPQPEECVFDRMRGENGTMLGNGIKADNLRPRRYLWDKIYLINMPSGDEVFAPGSSGAHYRNVVVVIPRVPKVAGNTRYLINRPDPDGSDHPSIADYGLGMEFCTIADLRTFMQLDYNLGLMQNGDAAGGQEPFAYVRTGNNLIFAPNKSLNSATHTSGLTTEVLWEATNPGLREAPDLTLDTAFATLGTGCAARYELEPGAAGYKSGSGDHIPVDDFYGRIRGAQTSEGAYD